MAVTVHRPSIPPLHRPTTTTHRPADFKFIHTENLERFCCLRARQDRQENITHIYQKRDFEAKSEPKLFFAQAF